MSVEGANPCLPEMITQPASHQASRRKGAVVTKAWLVVDSAGQAQPINAGKHMIMRSTGLAACDLRILDPLLFYPAAIMGRERAIVINFEHVKGIITAQDVWLLNYKDPVVAPFAAELQRRISRYHLSKLAKVKGAGGREEYCEEFKEQHNKSKSLPFEFVALETCLASVCSSMDKEVKALEREAYPVLDKLTTKISTRRLERVRQIKSRLNAVTARVQKIKDQIEHLLENDGHMNEMYLTRKVLREGNEDSCAVDDENERDGINDREEVDDEEEYEIVPIDYKHGDTTKQFDIRELEMLLEAYFVQVEGTTNGLSALREYIEDTEAYVNIMLDEKQNTVLHMSVMVKTTSLMLNWPIVVTGLFGMNINNGLYNPPSNTSTFLWATGGGIIMFFVSYVIILVYYRRKHIV